MSVTVAQLHVCDADVFTADMQHMIHQNAGPFQWHPEEPTRLWVLHREAQSAAGARCFTLDKAMTFMHTAAAFEHGSTLYVYATAQTDVSPFRKVSGIMASHGLRSSGES